MEFPNIISIIYGHKICIYGMGEYGLQFFFFLKKRGVDIMCFGDQDVTKRGYALENTVCISYEEVLELDKTVAIVVAIKEPCAIVEKFRELGFIALSYEEVMKQLINEVPKRHDAKAIQDVEMIRQYKEAITAALEGERVTTQNKAINVIIQDVEKRNGLKVKNEDIRG